MSIIWHPPVLSRDPIIVKEEPDDDHRHNPAVNVEPPADDDGEDEKTEDLAGKKSTIWRPDLGRLRASVAEMEGLESEKEEKDTTKKAVKRKRAPRTKGPCEHGVKWRSNLQGVQRLSPREVLPFVPGVRWGIIMQARSSAL